MNNIKRISILLILFASIFSVFGFPHADIAGDLTKYKYVYVIPTAPITSSSGTSGYVYGNKFGTYGGVSGGPTQTISPSDAISGHLMQIGYTILPQLTPEFSEKTMVVSYGSLGRRNQSLFGYDLAIMIQFRDAKTQELVATIETEGRGSNEAEDILNAINRAMEIYRYGLSPWISAEIITNSKIGMEVYLSNKTPYVTNDIDIKIGYYREDELIHEQLVTVKASMNPGGSKEVYIKRDKQARQRGLKVKCQVLAY